MGGKNEAVRHRPRIVVGFEAVGYSNSLCLDEILLGGVGRHVQAEVVGADDLSLLADASHAGRGVDGTTDGDTSLRSSPSTAWRRTSVRGRLGSTWLGSVSAGLGIAASRMAVRDAEMGLTADGNGRLCKGELSSSRTGESDESELREHPLGVGRRVQLKLNECRVGRLKGNRVQHSTSGSRSELLLDFRTGTRRVEVRRRRRTVSRPRAGKACRLQRPALRHAYTHPI